MKKLLLIIILIAIVAVGVYQYMRMNTYSYHLDKAETVLIKIDELIQGKAQSAFIPAAYAQDGGVDEAAIARNAETAVNEIGMAQDIVNDMSDGANQINAQNKVNETAKHAKETFGNASEAVEGEGTKETIANAQGSLNDIENGAQERNQNRQNSFTNEDNQEQNQEQEQEQKQNKNPMEQDGENHEEDLNRDDDNTEAEDAARQGDDENETDVTGKDTLGRYQPLVDWKGNTPLPLEGDKEVLGDTAEIVGSDNVQEGVEAETSEALADSPLTTEAMQEAIDKMMQQ